jgi:hypothetical protein
MTKKHFDSIAKEINLSYNDGNLEQMSVIRELAVSLAEQFELANPRFNRSKFLAVALA